MSLDWENLNSYTCTTATTIAVCFQIKFVYCGRPWPTAYLIVAKPHTTIKVVSYCDIRNVYMHMEIVNNNQMCGFNLTVVQIAHQFLKHIHQLPKYKEGTNIDPQVENKVTLFNFFKTLINFKVPCNRHSTHRLVAHMQ